MKLKIIRIGKMRSNPKFYKEFESKRAFLKWIEDNVDDLDFDYVVEINYYLKQDEDDDE